MSQRCDNCKYFDCGKWDSCRRYPTHVHRNSDDVCGEWKSSEEKKPDYKHPEWVHSYGAYGGCWKWEQWEIRVESDGKFNIYGKNAFRFGDGCDTFEAAKEFVKVRFCPTA